MPAVLAEMVCAESVAGRIAESARRARGGRLGIVLFYTSGSAWGGPAFWRVRKKKTNTGILHYVQNDVFFCRKWDCFSGCEWFARLWRIASWCRWSDRGEAGGLRDRQGSPSEGDSFGRR